MATKAGKNAPHGPVVVSLPFLGRSWYRRGPAYWLRRALWSFCCLLILIMFSLMTGGLINAIATASIPMWVRILLLTLIAAAIVRSMTKAWGAFNVVNRARQRGEAVSLAQASGDDRTYRQRRRASTGGVGLGALARAGSTAAGGLLVISVIVNFGWGVVLFLASFQRYFSPDEFHAVEQIKRQQ
ncbi:MAG: hypothetical protein ACRDRI_15915 [Pseudonocardiaceae bacterium]